MAISTAEKHLSIDLLRFACSMRTCYRSVDLCAVLELDGNRLVIELHPANGQALGAINLPF